MSCCTANGFRLSGRIIAFAAACCAASATFWTGRRSSMNAISTSSASRTACSTISGRMPENLPGNPRRPLPMVPANRNRGRSSQTGLKSQHIPPELRDTYVGHSARAEFVRQLIVCAAASDSNVLILGETGTGKEIIARWIHYHGKRQSGHFEVVNCAGIPDYLLESELFGHERGAFTGALKDKIGKWVQADGGTLFLDEVGDLSPEHQAKILRVLEDGKIITVGGMKQVSVDARVIAATNRNLHLMATQGSFRKDLLYRLRTFLIPSPALHDHPEDIPPIANHLWRKITDDPKATLPESVITELQTRRWPGNAREIKSVLTCVHDLVGQEGMDRQVLCAVLDQQNGE